LDSDDLTKILRKDSKQYISLSCRLSKTRQIFGYSRDGFLLDLQVKIASGECFDAQFGRSTKVTLDHYSQQSNVHSISLSCHSKVIAEFLELSDRYHKKWEIDRTNVCSILGIVHSTR
jgi:hypothetical protein